VIDLLADQPLSLKAADYLRRYLDDAADWLGDAASVRRRLDWHLKATDVPSEEHLAITSRQLRHAHEVIETFGQLTVKDVSKGSSLPRRARASPFPELAA
jgi:hypothetical protein